MNRYYDNIDTIHQITMQLHLYSNILECLFCWKSNQFVSHGFIYKEHHHRECEAVGKRVICSNRYGKTGCGRTFSLTIANSIRDLAHTAIHLSAFIIALVAGKTIQKAYLKATGTNEPRNAYRWLNKIHKQSIDYRLFLKNRCANPVTYQSQSHRLRILLPLLKNLFEQLGKLPCAHFQRTAQSPFI